MPGFDERDGSGKRRPAINRYRFRCFAQAGNNASPFPIDDTVGSDPVDDEVLDGVGLQQLCHVASSFVHRLCPAPKLLEVPSDSFA